MTAATAVADPTREEVQSLDAAGPAPLKIVVSYGFWIFLLSDIIMFSAMFAAYAVLKGQTDGGPAPRDLFELSNAAIETVCLLFSSYTCGLAVLAAERRRMGLFYLGAAFTFVLGAVFVSLECAEFARMVSQGAGPSRSAFLSAFYGLVGLHGIHVSIGLLWLAFTVAQVAAKGPRDFVLRRVNCFALFWHALDIVWVAVLTLVYLQGTI
jgi:cytochrome o ubiquinol oxidase subunit III